MTQHSTKDYVFFKDMGIVEKTMQRLLDGKYEKSHATAGVRSAYPGFMTDLAVSTTNAFRGHKYNVVPKWIDGDELGRELKMRAEPLAHAISLTPFLDLSGVDARGNEWSRNYASSRSLHLGGLRKNGNMARPGTMELKDQIKMIKALVGEAGNRLVAFDDSIISGGTFEQLMSEFALHGLFFKKLVVGLSSATPATAAWLREDGREFEPVHDLPPDTFITMADCRDTLIGVDGTALILKGGMNGQPIERTGRAPDMDPWVSAETRLLIPKDKRLEFAFDQTLAGARYWDVMQQTGIWVSLGEAAPGLAELGERWFKWDPSMPMRDVAMRTADKLHREIFDPGITFREQGIERPLI